MRDNVGCALHVLILYSYYRMIVRPALSTLRRGVTQEFVARCFSLNMPALAKAADPVQQLFIDKIREYAQKSKYVIRK
jgi:hypothetical protein